MMEDLDSWIRMVKCQDAPYKSLFGCEDQLEAALGIALSVAESSLFKGVLVFGVGGNGKSAFPALLAHELHSRHRLPFVYIEADYDDIPVDERDPQHIQQSFKDLFNRMQSINEPKILVLDEIDGFVPPAHEVNAEWRTLVYFLRACVKQRPQNTLLVGVTNNPKQMEQTVSHLFYLPIYFPPTCRGIIMQMIRAELKRPEWCQLCIAYLNEMAELGFRPQGTTIRRVIDDFAAPLDRDESKWCNEISREAIVKGLVAHSGFPLTREKRDNYRKRNRDLITSSTKRCIPWWKEYYQMKCKSERGENAESVFEIKTEEEK